MDLDTFDTMHNDNDIHKAVNTIKDTWMHILLEFFKKMLIDLDENTDLQNYNMDSVVSEINMFLHTHDAPRISSVLNENIENAIKITELENGEITEPRNPSWHNLIHNPYTNIGYPNQKDMIPIIRIVDKPLISIKEQSERFPNITIYPVIDSYCIDYLFNKEIIDNKFNKSSRFVLEISRDTIVNELMEIRKYFNSTTKDYSEDLHAALCNSIVLLTDFIAPLILINMRRKQYVSTAFLTNIYQIFTKNCDNMISAQKYFYQIGNLILNGGFGKDVCSLWASQYATTTFDLIYPKQEITDFFSLIPESYNADDFPIRSYKEHITEGIINLYDQEKYHIDKEHCSLKQLVELVIVKYISCIINIALHTNSASVINEYKNFIKTIKSFVIICNDGELPVQGTYNAKNLFIFSVFNMYYNFNTFYTDLIKRYEIHTDVIPNTQNTSVECGEYTSDHGASFAKELFTTKKSNSLVREIGTRIENITTFEDAFSLFLDAKSHLDAIAMSNAKGDGDAAQCKSILLNTCGAMQNLLKGFDTPIA